MEIWSSTVCVVWAFVGTNFFQFLKTLAVTELTVASYEEDTFGVMQKTLPEILTTLLMLHDVSLFYHRSWLGQRIAMDRVYFLLLIRVTHAFFFYWFSASVHFHDIEIKFGLVFGLQNFSRFHQFLKVLKMQYMWEDDLLPPASEGWGT